MAAAAASTFQSTRPRGARRGRAAAAGHRGVSIHAPARGATLLSAKSRKWLQVSIHAPARGATLARAALPAVYRGFNPRAREGRDPCPRRSPSRISWFQSTRPRGARPSKNGCCCKSSGFQSTRPRGARRVIFKDERVASLVSIHAPARGATCLTRRAN